MKRIIALILVLFTVISSSVLLYSCDNGGNGGGNVDIGGSGGNNNTGGGNIDIGGNGGNTGNDSGSNKGEDYVPNCGKGDHLDDNNDKYCDLCNEYVIVVIDFYVLNDLHGRFCDTDTQPGVDDLATYLKLKEQTDDNVVLMASGDMWQGSAESNLTDGNILTEWMNQMNFVSMTLGNHEFDWGEDKIRENLDIAEFPFLAINIYNNKTNQLADYCTPSVLIERGDITIGIIGAIGDCYSSISANMVEDVHFKVGRELTSLVKAESDRLRAEGADLIVYSIHDGYGRSTSGSINSSAISGYYDTALSSGYVDLVFESHTHNSYTLVDPSGVYHLQAGAENNGISHVEIEVNSGNGNNKVNTAEIIRNSEYKDYEDDPETEALEDKYGELIDYLYAPIGVVSRTYSDSELEDYVAKLYLEKGLEKWSDQYDIVLGGGFLRTREPNHLYAGTKTYADVLTLLPFDNSIVLCKVSGYNLLNKFINTTNSDYHIALSQYGDSIKNNISANKQYYVIVDTYTAVYAYNGLTIVDYYDETTFARDLIAEAIKAGDFEVKQEDYSLTSIPDAISIGNKLGSNKATTEYYYIRGTIKSIQNPTYGNLYLVDENGNEIYVYGLYDSKGVRYDSMNIKPGAGDTITICSTIYKYDNGSITIELKNATLIEIE